MSLSRRTPARRISKITLIAAGSVLAVAGAAGGTVATWGPASPSPVTATMADTASFAGQHATASAQAVVLADPAHQLKSIEAGQAAARLIAAQRDATAKAAARQAAQRAITTAAQQAAQPQGDPQQIAEGLLGSFGWSSSQFSCLQPLWNAESGWNVSASNPSSGAYGIPQALPGSKMASAGPGWQTDAATQIGWGLQYIQVRYGSPCGAWSHEEAYGWY